MSVPGIGRKGAERLVVELRDKVAPPRAADDDGTPASAVAAGTLRDQVVEALVGLGFAAKPAEKAVDEVLGGSSGPADSSGVLRAALSQARAAVSEHDLEASLERALANTPADGESDLENKLRPARLAEFIGQPRVREQLDLVLQGALAPREPARPRPALRPARAWARPASR